MANAEQPKPRQAHRAADESCPKETGLPHATLAVALSLCLGLTPASAAWAVSAESQGIASSQEGSQGASATDSTDETSATPADGTLESTSGTPSQEPDNATSDPASSDKADAPTNSQQAPAAEGSPDDAASSEPAPSEATPGESQSEEGIAALAEGETDLGALWKSQSSGTDSTLTITEGGTYRLTDNLTVKGSIEVNAAGAEVVIDLAPTRLPPRPSRPPSSSRRLHAPRSPSPATLRRKPPLPRPRREPIPTEKPRQRRGSEPKQTPPIPQAPRAPRATQPNRQRRSSWRAGSSRTPSSQAPTRFLCATWAST